MKPIKLLPLLISSSLTLAACEGIPIGEVDNTHNETMIINNHKVECKLYNEANATLCLQAKIKDQGDWFLLKENEIQGFNYSWGYDYELEVEVEDLINPPEDSPAEKYTYKKEIQKSLVSTIKAFEISISHSPTTNYIKEVSGKDNTYKIFDEKDIICSPDICAELNQLTTDNKAILMELKHQAPASKPLDLIKIKCSADISKFKKDCL